MTAINFKPRFLKSLLAATVLLTGASAVMAQSAVTIYAESSTATLADGQTVPMWGLRCEQTAPAPSGAVCTAANGGAQAANVWSPPRITVPAGPLTITLVNNLSFTAGTGTNNIPTSLVIVGQLGGGLGEANPNRIDIQHAPQGTTWPGQLGGTGVGDTVFTPPVQAARVRTFGKEVAVGATGTAAELPWPNLRPGTYVIESGTEPGVQGPMGLYGILVVTDPVAGTAYGTAYDQDLTVLMSEIDPVQNAEVDAVVRTAGFDEAKVWSGLTDRCGNALSADYHTCYPPTVNYSPRYFLVNGAAFDKLNPASTALTVSNAAASGNVLLRLANAGLRMHIPAVVNQNMTLLAEDGNKLPGRPRVQAEVFMAAGKTYDVTLSLANASAVFADGVFPLFDRSLSLSTNNQRDGGMQANIYVGAAAPATATAGTAVADTYNLVSGNALVISDPARGLLANDSGIYGAKLSTLSGIAAADLKLNANGTFTYVGAATGSFDYCGNGAVAPSSACATVTIQACSGACLGGEPVAVADTYTSPIATGLRVGAPGVLGNDSDPSSFPLHTGTVSNATNGTVALNADGSFVVAPTCAQPCAVTFDYLALNSQNTASLAAGSVTVNFGAASGLTVHVLDAKDESLPELTDYRWIIEEDRTVKIDPSVETTAGGIPPLNLGVNFHSASMPVVAQGCTGPLSCELGQMVQAVAAVCDIGNGVCRTGIDQKTAVLPGEVTLDPTKHYYISILPGDAANDTDADVAHGMGGAEVPAGVTDVKVTLQPLPYNTAKIAVFVFEDDHPLNGEHDGGGPTNPLPMDEPGLDDFNIVLLDQTGMFGDPAGQLTYDEFGQPVSNSLAGTIDPATGLDACPISPTSTDKLIGVIITCPRYEADPATGAMTTTESPLRGHAIIANMYPGLYEVHTTQGADRTARGEEWLQTNTLDGTRDIEAFIKSAEPGYFQEFGPGGFHVAVGFANPKIINARLTQYCAGVDPVDPNISHPIKDCTGDIYGMVTSTRLSRTPDQRVYSSGSYAPYTFTQCYVSLGEPDSADFAFTKCDGDGKFHFTGVPKSTNLRVTVFDQYADLLVDGLSTPIKMGTSSFGTATNPVEIAVTQWRTNLAGRIFLDLGNCTDDSGPGVAGDGVSQACEPGLPLVPYNIRYRDGSYMGFNNTDLAGYAGFNEVFPFLNWLIVDIDNARYKTTGVHVAYDSGGPVDGGPCTSSTSSPCGNSSIAAGVANTYESPTAHVPADLRIPGARYCASADCPAADLGFDPDPTAAQAGSSGRVDPGWVPAEGWQGLLGQNSFIEYAMKPFAPNENGGIKGHVIYTTTRPFDDPAILLQLSWEPGVANVKLNLYQQGTGPDGTQTLKLVDTTYTSSFDAWSQGFYNGQAGANTPFMSCPGQEQTSPFWFTMQNSVQNLNPGVTIPHQSQFKCYDGWSASNQVQPVPYDGQYRFPSITHRDSVTGKATIADTNCSICVANPSTDADGGAPMLPPGKYVVEVVLPDGYELVKEEDKNILLGDVYNAPVTQQFAGFGNIFIMPDQAAVGSTYYGGPAYNPLNLVQQTNDNGTPPRREGDTGSVEVFWPCVGQKRVVPDFNSLFPGAQQAAPFAGAERPLCDRKEVTLGSEMTALAKFYVFSSAHKAGHFTGAITNDFASEFDPFSPQFGEKFGVPNVPVGVKDFSGKEVNRVYADQWGMYNGLNYSTWTVNPPSPSGYIPQMMIYCMNDPGPILDKDAASPTFGQMITDPNYNPAYSNFCYEIPFMPGQNAVLDTPVVPTMAFADSYNLPDCEYPDATPAVKLVYGDSAVGTAGTPTTAGPWVSAGNRSLHITALGDRRVINPAYSGPSVATPPYNNKRVTRHYGFGNSQGAGSVSIGGVNAPVTSWSDTDIVVTVPSTVPLCSSGNPTYRNANATARCGELVITAGNGKRSVDTVTVTVGGVAPIYVAAPTSASTVNPGPYGRVVPSPLQEAIDAAAPGSLLILGSGTFHENVILWKPLRLQGVGAETTFINADAHPAGKMDAWRKQINCLFGLTLDGRPSGTYNNDGSFTPTVYDGCPIAQFNKVDRNDREGIIGWDATTNGNVAQQLQEPTLMGAYEGAGISVVGKGVRYPRNQDPFAVANAGAFPAGTQYLDQGNIDMRCAETGGPANQNPLFDRYDHATANFRCNPSRIDGIGVINSSQGGGGIFLHGWQHYTEVSNNRVHGNHGTLTGGITIGNGEITTSLIAGGVDPIPFAVPFNTPAGTQLGFGINKFVHVHHNAVTANASLGDALFSATPSGGGGVTFCSGADNYTFDYNWICGNLSPGDGGGVVHLGFTNDATMAHNWVLFNQSQNPTIPTNGGGIAVTGASPDRTILTGAAAGQECGTTTDADCPPGLADGTGRNLLIDGNLILGNSAESGTGGGLVLQKVNGTDVVTFPTRPNRVTTGPQSGRSPGWNNVMVVNNIIANNVAGWDGAGISMVDALKVRLINNTVIANDTTASAGVLFNTLGAVMSAVNPPGCQPGTLPTDLSPGCDNPVTTSVDQPSGIVALPNTFNLDASLNGATNIGATAIGPVRCPADYGYTGTVTNNTILNGQCRKIGLPDIRNNIVWKNRAFHIGVGTIGTGPQDQQAVVTLYPSLDQTLTTGNCPASGTADPANPLPPNNTATPVYWDLGIRGDDTPAPNSGSGYTLVPSNSILTDTTNYAGNGNLASDPLVVSLYCNGGRAPVEGGFGPRAYQVPPGHSEATGLYPIFMLNQITPAATVDEGNNWINLGFGPLSLTNASKLPVDTGYNVPLGDYSITTGSPAIDQGNGNNVNAPNHDFFGNARPLGLSFDIGAVEVVPPPADLSVTKSDGQTIVTRGQQLTYQIVVSNAGPNSTTGAVTDTLPGGSTFTVSSWSCVATGGSCTATGTGNSTRGGTVSLASGGSATYTLVGTVAPTAPTSGAMTNRVAVTGANDPTPGNNTASDVDTLRAPSADLSVTKTDGVTTVTRGQQVTYTVVVSNAAGSDATTGTVTDFLPQVFGGTTFTVSSWTCVATGGSCTATGTGTILRGGSVTLTAGGTATYTLVGTVPQNAPLTGSMINSVIVLGTVTDPTPGNNFASDTDTRVAPPTDLSVTKTDGVTTVRRADTLTYTVVVNNAGPNATTAPIVDTLPGGATFLVTSWSCVATAGSSCTATGGPLNIARGGSVSLVSGGTATYTLTGTVPPTAPTSGTMTNSVAVTYAADTSPGNNTASDTDTRVP